MFTAGNPHNQNLWLLPFLALWILPGLAGCGSENSQEILRRHWQDVRVRFLDEPGNLNPITGRGVSSEEVHTLIFQFLFGRDPADLSFVPILIDSLPIMERIKGADGRDSLILFHFRLLPDITWQDGKPLTVRDVLFTWKVLKNQYVHHEPLRPYHDMFIDIWVDPEDSLAFTLVANRPHFQLFSYAAGIAPIIPEHFYDPEGLLRPFSVRELALHWEEVIENPDARERLRKFADRFNAVVNDPKDFLGSGPYRLVEYSPERVVLERVQNWWADRLPSEKKSLWHHAYPRKIIFEVIGDETTAQASLHRFRIDVISFTRVSIFDQLKRDPALSHHYQFLDTTYLAYTYIGLNMRSPALADVRVRRALAHLVNRERIIEKVLLGYGEPVIGPVHPVHTKFYNDTLTPYEYNPDKARILLQEAGWKDSDNDGILDKLIQGEKVDLRLQLIINSGNETRKNIALMLQEEARRVGIEISIEQVDWSIYLERLRNRDFDMNIGGWVMGVEPSDPKQIWHTESSAQGGDNFVGFGNDTTDAIIEKLRTSLNRDSVAHYWRLLQVYIHRDVPYIFLYAPRRMVVIHKRFPVQLHLIRPGYSLQLFQPSGSPPGTADTLQTAGWNVYPTGVLLTQNL